MKILLVNDQPMFIEGMRIILHKLDDAVEIQISGSCEEALELLGKNGDIGLLLLDLDLHGMSDLDCLQQLHLKLSATSIVFLSEFKDRNKVLRAIEMGAKGYILKSSTLDIIITALQLVLSGGVYLPTVILDPINPPQETNKKRMKSYADTSTNWGIETIDQGSL